MLPPTTAIDSALGHASTVGRNLFDRFFPPPVPSGQPFHAVLTDPRIGEVRLTGRLHRSGSSALLVLVHGLGGSADSGCMRRMAAAAVRRGFDVLRMNMRGADRSGADIYHAGLTEDLEVACADKMLADYSARAVVGYSLGGNTALRFAATTPIEIDAAVAVCSPLDLGLGSAFIDSARRRVYRGHLLGGLREIYRRSAPRIADVIGVYPSEIDSIRTIRQWDDRIVAARFGFSSADQYYREASALAVLDTLNCRSLIVRAENDPMVSAEASALNQFSATGEREIPTARRIPEHLEFWRLRHGGHLGFVGNSRIEERILNWLVAGSESLNRALRPA